MALELRYSVHNASAGDTDAGSAALSLGKFCSTTVMASAVDATLFDDVSGGESTAGDEEYRVIFLANPNAWAETDVSLYLAGADLGDEAVTLAILESELVDLDAAGPTWQCAVIGSGGPPPTGDEGGTPLLVDGSPAAYVFSTPTVDAPLTIAQIPAGYGQAVCVKRVVSASANRKTGATVSLVGVSSHPA